MEHTENIYATLSAARFEDKTFDLIILGTFSEDASGHLPSSIAELKGKFGGSRRMLYTTVYDHILIAKMEAFGIDAYIIYL